MYLLPGQHEGLHRSHCAAAVADGRRPRLESRRYFYIALFTSEFRSFTPADHEIFRLRDEVATHEGNNVTFYSFVGVKPSATIDEINKAYRKASRNLHPDKARQNFFNSYNLPPPASASKDGSKPGVHVHKSKQPSQREVDKFNKEASARFARLGVVANILRGPERKRYDHFLYNGFPRWRGTGYYYQRFRPGLGTVLTGLFVFLGGGAHYLVLYLGWRKQREFVERYIKHARRSAWGDDSGLGGIPGLGANGGTATPPQAQQNSEQEEPGQAMQWNRRQKRMQERQDKKALKNPKAAKAAEKAKTSGISTPVEVEMTSGPVGAKKRTVAENGKVLIVDSVGNVYLEEKTEEGQTHEFLLDVCPSLVASSFLANIHPRSTRSICQPSSTPFSAPYPSGRTTRA